MNRALSIWRSYAGRMGLYALHAKRIQSHGIKLVHGWYALLATIKRQLQPERFLRKRVPHLQYGLKPHGI